MAGDFINIRSDMLFSDLIGYSNGSGVEES